MKALLSGPLQEVHTKMPILQRNIQSKPHSKEEEEEGREGEGEGLASNLLLAQLREAVVTSITDGLLPVTEASVPVVVVLSSTQRL